MGEGERGNGTSESPCTVLMSRNTIRPHKKHTHTDLTPPSKKNASTLLRNTCTPHKKGTHPYCRPLHKNCTPSPGPPTPWRRPGAQDHCIYVPRRASASGSLAPRSPAGHPGDAPLPELLPAPVARHLPVTSSPAVRPQGGSRGGLGTDPTIAPARPVSSQLTPSPTGLPSHRKQSAPPSSHQPASTLPIGQANSAADGAQSREGLLPGGWHAHPIGRQRTALRGMLTRRPIGVRLGGAERGVRGWVGVPASDWLRRGRAR